MLIIGAMFGILLRLAIKAMMTPSRSEEPFPDRDYGFDDVQVHIYFSPEADDPNQDFGKAVQCALINLRQRCAKYRTRYYMAINKQWRRNGFKVIRKSVPDHKDLEEIRNICDGVDIGYNAICYFFNDSDTVVGYCIGPAPKLHLNVIKQRMKQCQNQRGEK
ncbi:unnamed protein product [Moneuplotes crassus]|uniref:Uncharacterized protein n=1 Tax=Euplotes crassus TaxID=5936 RepID=A0AAD1Y0W1_EUPCR|nr:unnamed protein product [Moneuplotes crassus]